MTVELLKFQDKDLYYLLDISTNAGMTLTWVDLVDLKDKIYAMRGV